jgi:hypothetical protein
MAKKIGTVMNFVPDYELKPQKVLTDYRIYDFLPFGYDNLFPQACALFARSSPIHRGVINGKVKYITAELQASNKKIVPLLTKANFEGESLSQVIAKSNRDNFTGGNRYVEIITDARKSFLWFNHIDFTKVRLSKDLETVQLHPDWWRYKGLKDVEVTTLPLYPDFEMMPSEYGMPVLRSVYHFKDYEPEFYFYGVPDWIAGQDAVLIDLKTNKWNLSRLKNSFMVSGFLVVPVKDKDEGAEVIDYIDKNHKGEGNQAKLMVITKSRGTEGEKADRTQFIESKQENEGSWENLHAQSLSDIVISHNWYRALTSIPDNTGFDTNRILNEYNVALRTVISSEQQTWLNFFKRIFLEQMNIESDLVFINKPPIEDTRYQYIWQIKKKRGDDDWSESDPNQQQMIM